MNPNVDSPQGHSRHVTYIIGTYPLLTTTFIDREINLLRQRGLRLDVLSLRRPTAPLSPEQEQIMHSVTYLLPVSPLQLLQAFVYFLWRRPLTMARTLRHLLASPHPNIKAWLKTWLHFGEGVCAANLLRHNPPHRLHAHFVDRAAIVALVAGRLLDVPYSATAHANDIYVQPVLLPQKVAAADFVATCTGYNQTYLHNLLGNGASGNKIHRIYHGLDIARYTPQKDKAEREPWRLLAVGQLKEKKGFTHLLGACRRLKERGYHFDCVIVGGGPLHSTLQAQIERDDLTGIVTLTGALPHPQVIEHFRRATVFALPCILAADGDRDGIPNVILEAMALHVPVVSTAHSGIPEVIDDGVNGFLTPPGDEEALADAIGRLFDSPALRRDFALCGRRTVEEIFSVEANVEQLLREFVT